MSCGFSLGSEPVVNTGLGWPNCRKLCRQPDWPLNVGCRHRGPNQAIFAALAAAVIIPHFGWNALFLLGIIPVVLTYFIRQHVSESAEFITAHAQAQANTKNCRQSPLCNPSLSGANPGLNGNGHCPNRWLLRQ